jgi:hypothetical protein
MSAAVLTETKARIAGLLYLTSILTGGAAAVVRAQLFVPGDATATATSILAHEPLFRMLLAADLISASCYVLAILLVYEIFKRVNGRFSLLAAVFGLMSCAIVAFASLFHIGALVVLKGAQYLNILAMQPLPDLALMCLKLWAQAYSISLVFAGLSCLLIGYLIFKSSLNSAATRRPAHRPHRAASVVADARVRDGARAVAAH